MNKKAFKPSTAAEREFMRALKKVAKISGHMVETHVDGHRLRDEAGMQKALENYSKLLEPWAKRQAKKMLEKVSRSNRNSYERAANLRLAKRNAKEMGRQLKSTVAEADVGLTASRLMDEQVDLIQSIPLKAGLRAQHLARQALYEGTRAGDIAKALAESEDVSEAQAMTIARTEVARANASITQARAQAVGSSKYRWRNSGDEAVREAHLYLHGKKLDGQIFSWDNPPTLDDGTRGHPGTFPNCRCYPEPIFDAE